MKMVPIALLFLAGLQTAVNESSELLEGKYDPNLPLLHKTDKDSPHEIGLSFYPPPGLNFSVEWSLAQECCTWVQAETSIINVNDKRTEIKVIGLRSYTEYKIRLRNVQTNSFSKFIPVKTREERGKPPSPPKIISVRQLDNMKGYLEFRPPILPNGEIFLYSIEYRIIDSQEWGGRTIHDVKTGSASFGPLKCNVTYQVKLMAQTETSSLSDPDYTKLKTFCPEQVLPDLTESPIALYVLNNTVYLKDISNKNIHSKPRQLTQMQELITRMDFHVEKRYLYLVNSEGKIRRETLTKSFQSKKDFTYLGQDYVLEMSVDWIYHKIYILKQDTTSSDTKRPIWTIDVCDLKGENCEKVEKYFTSNLKQIQVDPYNGYVYYLTQEKGEEVLRRINITTAPNNHCQLQPEVMLKSDRLGQFVVSYDENTIFIPNIDKNRMFSVNLDYPFKVNVLYETAIGKQMYHSVKSLIRYEGNNYWTSDQGFHTESLSSVDGYKYNLVDPDITSQHMKLFNVSIQPYPAVLNTVTEVQAVLTDTKGLITWRPPFPQNNACAAYIHQWKYNIHLNNTKYNTQTIFTNISNTYIHVENLKNASLYNIVVQPYARNQFAPFSFPISSNTLPYQIDLKLLWTSGQRIYVLNGTANTEMTVDVDYVTNFKNLIMIEDSNDNLYFTSENVIYAHDLSNNNYRILYTADYEITNLIYDSYSERFYYSNHVNKTIARITLQGFEETKYYLNSAPDEIMIDSELAKLCWHSKDIGVFCQDLGQTEINTLLITKVVNAKVTNVVMDTNSHKIIFTKYTPLEATRYELHEINIANNDTKFIEKLSFPYIKDGIFSIPGKIIFQQVSLSLIIFDIESKSFFESSMHQNIEHLSISTKLDPNKRKLLPPTEIDPISLTIGEQNGGYIIKWRASDSNLILNVIYKVTLDDQEYFTNETYIEYINIKPFQKLKVTLTPTTKLAYGKKITKILYTEEKKPSRPENPRIFWSTKDEDYFDFTLRWEKPLEENGILLNYTIQCFHVSNDTAACTDIHTNGSINEAKFSLLKSDYYFTIKASTSAGFGQESLPVYSIKTEVIPVPVLFLGSSQPKAIHIVDLDLNQTRNYLLSSIPTKINYDSKSNSVFYIDNYQNLAKLNLETEETRILKQIDLHNPEMSLDFVARFLYITGSNKIYRYDIESSNSKLKLIHLTKFQIKQIQVAYDGQIYIVSEDNELHILRFKQSETFMKQILLQDPMCPRNNEISQITPTTAKGETSLIVMNTANQLFSLDTGSLTCTKLPENMNHKVNYLKANTNNIFYLDDNSNELFRKFNGSPQDDKIFTPININKIVSLEVKCDECQLVPVQCKILTFSTQEIQLKEIDSSSVVVKLPAALQPTDCKFNLPPTNYTILTRMVHGRMENSSAYYKYIDNLGDQDFSIPNLMGNTEYETCVLISNIYVSSFSNKIICKNFTTLVGIPNAPEIRDVTILSPHKARFNWTLSGLEYSGNVTVIATVQSTSLEHGQTFTHNMYFYHNNLYGDIDNLLANTEYTVYLEALNSRNITGLKSNVLVFKTFGEPYVLSEPDITATSIIFNISAERTQSSQQIIVQDDNSSVLLFFDATSNLIQGDRRLISFTADNLTELTCYHININSSYVTNPENTYTHSLFENCIETESSRPQTPSVPKIETDDSGRNYMTWTKQDSKVWYELQIKNLELDEDWKTARNTTENIFVTHTLDAGNYTFRVRAANENGKSEYSAESEVVDIEKIRSQAFVSKSNSLTVIAITISFTCIILIFIGGAIFAKKLRTFDKNTKKSNGIWDENPIYGKPLTDEDLKEIPQIKRDQISFLNFLGRGAFGEVYQGTMKNMHDLDKGIAIKMLRQDASEMDKADFLKEAKIMWHFKHDHIVNLEAICLDVDANFLILELMEEGDLLRYLRNNRPKGDVYKLSLLDQVEMSLDVAKGLEYLEENKYVHRDIAARNCLVSRYNSDRRNVKLADFGLARDIYKVDYYRAKSKNPLPVKWMSPEGLRDRKFTTQSDVWSFGILIWEILTFGTDPYPTMENCEVMNYVINGKRLYCPEGTPERLVKMVTGCWSFEPDGRPSFKTCVQLLSELIQDDQYRTSIMSSYMPFINGYNSTCSDRGERTATTVPMSQAPRYLQLIHSDYSVPSEHSGINCSCTQDRGSIDYGNLRVSHDSNCDFSDVNLNSSGDTSATASVQTVARMSAPPSVYYETKTHATSNPCYLSCHNHVSDDNIRVDKVEKVVEENEEVDQESSSQDLDSKSLTPSLDSLSSTGVIVEDRDTPDITDTPDIRDTQNNNTMHKEETRETRVNSQSSQDSMISGTTDSGQGSATSCGSTSDDEIVNIGDDLQEIPMHELMNQFYHNKQPQYDFPKHSGSYHKNQQQKTSTQ